MTGAHGDVSESPRKRRKQSSERAQKFLETAKLLDACNAGQKLLFLEHSWTVARALKELGERRIFSAPLFIKPDLEDAGREGVENPQPTFLGWVDITTILQAFLKGLQQQQQQIPNKMLQLMPLLEAEGKMFAQKPLISIADAQDKALVFQADAKTSLLSAMRDMFLKGYSSAGQKGVHRVAIFDAHGAISCIVSQLDVMRFILQHVTQLGYIANESLDALGLPVGTSSVLVLDHAVPALIAFQQLYQKGMSSAAIQAQGGQTIANLSISDLRCIQAEHFGKLALPVAEFLALTHETAYAGYAASGPNNINQIQEEPFYDQAVTGSNPPKSSQSLMQQCPSSPSKKSQSPPKAGTAQHLPEQHPPAQLDRVNTGIAIMQPITCTPESTLTEVLELMVSNSVHRIYVANDQNQTTPQQSITPTDIMHMLLLLGH